MFSRRAAEYIEPRSSSENERTRRDLRSWEEFTEKNHHFSCTISSTSISPQPLHIDRRSLCSLLIRPKVSPRSQPLTYHLSGSISSAALREKSDNQGQHWISTKSGEVRHPASPKLGRLQHRWLHLYTIYRAFGSTPISGTCADVVIRHGADATVGPHVLCRLYHVDDGIDREDDAHDAYGRALPGHQREGEKIAAHGHAGIAYG